MSVNPVKLTVERINAECIGAAWSGEIDSFIQNHGGTVFHEVALNRIAAAAFGTCLSYFLAYQGGRLIGCCPCHTFSRRLLSASFSNLSSYEMPYGGWIYDAQSTSLGKLMAKTKTGFLEALSIVSNIVLDPIQEQAYLDLGAKAHDTVLIKLTGMNEEEIFTNLKHSQKQKIRRALKLGLEAVSLGPEDFAVFTGLNADLKNNANLRIRDGSFYSGVFSHYHGLGRAVCTAVRYQDQYISTGIALANKNYAIGWAAGRKIGIPNNLYQNELLIWDQIKWANRLGCAYLDLGAIHPDRLPHLLRMKFSFSKETRYFYSYSIRKWPYRVVNKARVLLKRDLNVYQIYVLFKQRANLLR